MLDGLKTYLVVAVAILSSLFAYMTGEMTLLQTVQAAGLALGLGGNRAVIWAGQVINSPFSGAPGRTPDTRTRMIVVYVGVALTIASAALAGLNGEQDLVVTIGAILAALGLNFLGLGAKKQADGIPPATA